MSLYKLIHDAGLNNNKDAVDFYAYNKQICKFALDGAATGGHLELVKYCISKGVNNFDYAIDISVQKGHKEISALLIKLRKSQPYKVKRENIHSGRFCGYITD